MLKKFRDWMNYNPPTSLPWDGWDDFRDEFKKNAPVRFFITKKIGGKLSLIAARCRGMLAQIRFRTVNRKHIVKTGLKPGWYDTDTRILYANFNLLVEYVEQECAHMEIVFDEAATKDALGWKRFLPRIVRRPYRNRELGLKHLHWETTLDDPALDEYEASPHQAEKARKVLELYHWWTEERPKREEVPYPLDEAEGFNVLSERWRNSNPEKEAVIREWARAVNEQEAAWDDEDTEKLIELIKIRRGLWT